MTLTIEHNGKTYEWVGKERFIAFGTVQGMIDAGELVELQPQEENTEETEAQRIDRKLTEQFTRDNVACVPCESAKPNNEQSTLQKLRSELERRIEVSTYTSDRMLYRGLIAFLNELEEAETHPLAPEKLNLPDFDYEKLEENVRDVEFEKIDEARHMIGHIGRQVEAITKYLLTERAEQITK